MERSIRLRYISRSSDYPDLRKFKYKCFDDDYIELDDDFARDCSNCNDSADPHAIKKLLEKHAMKNKFAPNPEFGTSPICIKDADFDFSIDLSLISMVETDPFYGKENEDVLHTSLNSLS